MNVTHGEQLALDRNGLEVLSMEACLELAGSVPIARVAANGPGSPIILPVTHLVLGTAVVFRTSSGSKLDAAIMNRLVSVEIDEWNLATRTGWSVLLRGTAELVEDEETLQRVSGMVEEPWIQTTREMSWMRVRPDEISGRRIPST
jgi:nitroimidazol reductase NimA-like FMN-containing flavoprotein (pyridoxamine 5'-phosphate oxidase superfamily)